MKAYSEYRVSGIPWVAEIPSGWVIVPLMSVLKESKVKNDHLAENNLLSLSFGRIVRKDIETVGGLLPASFETYQIVEPDHLVFRFTDLQNDQRSLRTARVVERGIITSAYISARPTDIDARYSAYLMRSYDHTKVFYGLGGGVRQTLKFSDVARLPILLPSAAEQRTIADYLDRETARIDTLIEEQQRLVEMLHERRQALVERSMLASSDAPIRLSRIASSRSGDVPPPLEEEGEYVIWGAGRVVGRTSQVNAQAGNILVGRVGQGSVGKVRRLTESAWATDNTIILRLDSSAADSRYIEHGLRMIPRFELVGGGAMPLVTAERLLSQSVPFTTLATQKEVVISLDQLTAKIDLLITETERFIELSKERRTALITAAVTGQIDVRGMA